jgi:DNA-binding NarL/FixJ family response regulator
LGVRGILTKSALPTELQECIHAVIEGRYWAFGTSVSNLVALLQELMKESQDAPKNTFRLTPRELQITALVAEGCTNKDVAAESKISEETVKHHLKNIFDKTGVSNRLELAIFAMNHSLLRSS